MVKMRQRMKEHKDREDPLFQDRLVNSLQESLVSDNCDDLELPVDKREVSGVLAKKKRNVPDQKITSHNFKRIVEGRQPEANVIRAEWGVMP